MPFIISLSRHAIIRPKIQITIKKKPIKLSLVMIVMNVQEITYFNIRFISIRQSSNSSKVKWMDRQLRHHNCIILIIKTKSYHQNYQIIGSFINKNSEKYYFNFLGEF